MRASIYCPFCNTIYVADVPHQHDQVQCAREHGQAILPDPPRDLYTLLAEWIYRDGEKPSRFLACAEPERHAPGCECGRL